MTTGRRTILLAIPLAVVAVVAVFAVVGRGGNDRLSKPQYERKVQTVYAGVQQAFRETNVKAPAELAVRVEAAQQQLRVAAEELDGIEPPKTVEAENQEIVDGMRAYADDLDALRVAAGRGDQGAIENFTAKIGANQAVQKIAAAARAMELEGYELGPISGE
jgi:hypothetical protein